MTRCEKGKTSPLFMRQIAAKSLTSVDERSNLLTQQSPLTDKKLIRTTLKIEQYLSIKIQLWNSLQPLGDSILIYA